MDDGQEQDHYEERLKELFDSFDTNGVGSLCREELSALCQSLQLDDAAPSLFQTLLRDDDGDGARVKSLFQPVWMLCSPPCFGGKRGAMRSVSGLFLSDPFENARNGTFELPRECKAHLQDPLLFCL